MKAISMVHLQIPSVSAAKARLLFNAGLTSLQSLSMADEERIATALAVGVRHRPTDARHAALRIGKTGEQGTNALVARSARQIWQSMPPPPTLLPTNTNHPPPPPTNGCARQGGGVDLTHLFSPLRYL